MKIERESAEGRNLFTGYGDGYVEVNARRLTASLVVTADRLEENWGPEAVEQISSIQLEALAAFSPEIVLLGTGTTLRFPHPALLAPLYAAHIGVEVMDTRAACRTYNILLGEGRKVLAALII
jgi:uncharacterized protein